MSTAAAAILTCVTLVCVGCAIAAALYQLQARDTAHELRRKLVRVEEFDTDLAGTKAALYKLRGYVYATNKRARDATRQPDPEPPDDPELDPELAALLQHQAAPPAPRT